MPYKQPYVMNLMIRHFRQMNPPIPVQCGKSSVEFRGDLSFKNRPDSESLHNSPSIPIPQVSIASSLCEKNLWLSNELFFKFFYLQTVFFC